MQIPKKLEKMDDLKLNVRDLSDLEAMTVEIQGSIQSCIEFASMEQVSFHLV